MNSLAIIIALAAVTETAAPPVPPPPPTVVLVPPPPMTPPQVRISRPAELPLTTFDVVVTSGRDTLWSGSLRVGNAGANFSQTLREAYEACPTKAVQDPNADRFGEDSRQLGVGISRRPWRDEPDRFAVNGRWTRPLAPCEGLGNRSVSLDQVVVIAPGQTLRIKGDAGFEIALTRRAK